MGVTAAVAIVAVAAGTTAYESNQTAHAETNAHTAMAENEMEVQNQIQAANTQTKNTENQQAQSTASAQARVRAISNPDGDSIMTNPLGSGQNKSGDNNDQIGGSAPAASPSKPSPNPAAMNATPGKSTIGG